YDPARSTELGEEQQRTAVESPADAAKDAEFSIGRAPTHARALGTWYAPAGDGGAIIFSSRLSAVAWQFATDLSKRAARRDLDLRVGVHSGQMVERGERVPVGPAVVRADQANASAETGGLCVTAEYWESLRVSDREEHTWSKLADGSRLCKVGPGEVGSGDAGGLSPFWNVPNRGDYFTGREEILAELATRLEDDRAAALTQAIVGLG
ncbi:MAG: hypothetical protein GY856_25075, partial [bacterium]|nr:hypothetical protein [bacterium]